MNDAIILIGPINTGKSTIGRLLANKLNLPQYPMDQLRWGYYHEIGYYDQRIELNHKPEHGFQSLARQWKPFEIHAVERLLAERTQGVIDFGAGHSVYEDDQLFARAIKALAPFPNVVLIMPSPDLEESLKILRERMQNASEDGHEVNAQLASHHSNWDMAKIIVYTKDKTPEETCDEVASKVILSKGESQ